MGCAHNRIVGNCIGVSAPYRELVGNCGSGITLCNNSRSNLIGGSISGAANVIAGNGKDGVSLFHPGTTANTISQNSIYFNAGRGISLADGANNSIDPPVITLVTSHSIEGSSGPGYTVEVFSDFGHQGGIYEGRVQTDGVGHFGFSSKPGGFSGRVVTATATDAAGNTSELGFAALVVTTTVERLNYAENDGPVRISGLKVTSTDSTNLIGATVSITIGFQTAEDVLAFAPQTGITGAFSSATGVLTLSGTASVADYQEVLRSVTYQNTSANPNTLPRVVTFVVNDGTLTGSTTLMIAITAVNEAPQVTTTLGALNYTENDGLVRIDGGLTVTDVDSTNLVGAAVSITGVFQTAEDVLAFTNQNGIVGDFNSATGVLTLSGDGQRGVLPDGAAVGDLPEHQHEPAHEAAGG